MSNTRILIMCEGPNELEIINILLSYEKLKFTEDNLLDLRAFHARQINGTVKNALNLFNNGDVIVLRIGDTLNEKLKIKGYENKIKKVYKICTKPELEILLIIAEGLINQYNKVKSNDTPKKFSKENIKLGRRKYKNDTQFYTDYFGNNVNKLIDAITTYKRIKAHKNDEYFLADLLKDN